jgi:anti-anti-sigma factor
VDSVTAVDLEKELLGLLNPDITAVVCNLSKTEYISSAGLRVLLALAKNLRKSARKLILCAPTHYVSEILETAGLTHVLEIYETEAAALQKLA